MAIRIQPERRLSISNLHPVNPSALAQAASRLHTCLRIDLINPIGDKQLND